MRGATNSHIAGQRRLGGVQHHVTVAHALDERVQHRGERLASISSSRATRTASHSSSTLSERRPFVRSVFPDETRSTIVSAWLNRRAILTKPVTSTSVTSPGSSSLRQARVEGCDEQPRRGRPTPALVRLLGRRRLESARAETERQQLWHLRRRARARGRCRSTAIDHAVLHVLRHVRRADEQNLHRRVAAWKGERVIAVPPGPRPRPPAGGTSAPASVPWTVRRLLRSAAALERCAIAALSVSQPVRHRVTVVVVGSSSP